MRRSHGRKVDGPDGAENQQVGQTKLEPAILCPIESIFYMLRRNTMYLVIINDNLDFIFIIRILFCNFCTFL